MIFKKIPSHEFNENDIVNYIALVKKKRARSKNLKVKKLKYCKLFFKIIKLTRRLDVNAMLF